MRPIKCMLLIPAGLLSLQGLLFHTAFAQQLAEANSPAPAAQPQDVIDGAVRAQALIDRDAWQRAIADLETRDGSWGAELGEAWLGLGTTLRRLGQPGDAAEAFGKALQTLRIGYGLNDARQLPVLEQLREAQAEAGNWNEVHAAHYLIFHVAKQSGDEKLRVKALLDLGRWSHKASTENLVTDLDASPGRLSELYNNEIKRLVALDEEYDGKSMHLASLNLALAATELGEAKRKFEMPITEFQSPGSAEQRSYTSQQCVSGIDRSGRPFQYCTLPVEVPNLNYYLGPNAQKSTEIREHLARVETGVLAAFNILQGANDDSPDRSALQQEVQSLTAEYNAFVKLNPR